MEIKINYGKYEGSRDEIESSTSNNLNNIKILKKFYENNKLKGVFLGIIFLQEAQHLFQLQIFKI